MLKMPKEYPIVIKWLLLRKILRVINGMVLLPHRLPEEAGQWWIRIV